MRQMRSDGFSRAMRFVVLLALTPLVGCGETQPDLGGAVVVPEPGTTASADAGGGDALLETVE
ncbi:hypothetical protein [Tautonia rosea]|uniref:hypothetical protein n=1 Tax=Tautonia rosea TaxID=2728037 RepID=UPI001472DD1C|nr:hypothetical protein [Tautonia rosea]